MKQPRVALVHDWLTGMRGGEKCLEVLCELFPEAPIYTLVHNKNAMSPLIESKRIITSFIDSLPSKETRYRSYLPLFPFAISQFDFSDYDLIISTSHAVAKGAIPGKGATHICYCHTPMRYVWEMYDEYFGKGKSDLVTRTAMSIIAPFLRSWDVRSSERVHHFIANSINVQRRIQAHYGREADVIFPPVDLDLFQISRTLGEYYLIVSALVPYKKVDLAIDVFNKTGERLVIIGKGPEEKKLKEKAAKNVEFLGWQDDQTLAKYYQGCTALIFPGEEDFGIVPLEAMASGRPVIAYGKGGALETVIDGTTGLFFMEQTSESLFQAIKRSSNIQFDPESIRDHTRQFSRETYRRRMKSFIGQKFSQMVHL